MSKVCDTLKELMRMSLYLVLFAALVINLPALNAAFGILLDRMPNLASLKVGTVEIGFDQTSVAARLAATDLDPTEKSHVFKLVQKLDAEQFERLVYVNELANLCEYENPTAEMRQQVASDYLLRENGLVKITKNAALRDDVQHQIDVKAAAGQVSDIGNPLSCYDMKLTDAGLNVKTVLMKTFAAAFATHPNFLTRAKGEAQSQAMLTP